MRPLLQCPWCDAFGAPQRVISILTWSRDRVQGQEVRRARCGRCTYVESYTTSGYADLVLVVWQEKRAKSAAVRPRRRG